MGRWNVSGGKQDEWDNHRRTVSTDLGQFCGPPDAPSQTDHMDEALFWTAGLISVADWIGSAEQFFSPVRNEAGLTLEIARQGAAKALSEIGLETAPVTPDLTFNQLFDFDPNDLQMAAIEAITRPGVYVIEAPMGMGKTEAALAVAYHLICT